MLLKPPKSPNDLVDVAKRIEKAGLDQLWVSHIFGFDSISVMGLIAQEVTRISLCNTAVTPSYPRHPTAMAHKH